MAAQTPAAGPVSSPRSKEITRSPDHSDVDKLVALKARMQGLAFRIEEVCDGAKIVPPLEIILVPEFMQRVWYTHRLVPWIAGFVQWEIYLEYLGKFLELNRQALFTLELDQCLAFEKELVESCASLLSDEERSLSGRIMSEIEEFKKQKHCMSEEDSCLAAAGFMCIATEARLMMSRLAQYTLSPVVRKCAFDLVNKRLGCAAVSAALLGMATEAKLMLDLLKQNGVKPHLYSDVCTCRTVRNETLALLTKLQGSFMLDTPGNHDSGVASAEEPTSDITVDYLSAGDEHLGKNTDESKILNKKRKIQMLEEEVEAPVSATSEVRKDATEMNIDGVTEVNMQQSEVLADTAEDATEGGAQDSEGKTVPMDTDAMTEPTKKKAQKTNVPVAELVNGAMGAGELENPVEKEMARKGRVMEESKEKNAVKAYVYEIRSMLYQKYYDFVPSEDMQTLMAKLQEAEDWLYGDGQDETKEVYVAKLEELKKVAGPIEARCKELEEIGPALKQLVNCIHSSREVALSDDPELDYISMSDKEDVLYKCSEVETWMIGLLKHANPSDIKKKAKALDSFCKTITKPKPTGAAPEVQTPEQHPDVAAEPIELASEGGAWPAAEQMDTHTPVGFPNSSLA